jgi:hypothetical protein
VSTPIAWAVGHLRVSSRVDPVVVTTVEQVPDTKYRRRSIASLTAEDETPTLQLFHRLAAVAGRVGAAKTMHLFAPEFFPLWDNPIAGAYGHALNDAAAQYWLFMWQVKEQVAQIVPVHGVTSLKLLDEYNYCRFTKKWL